MTTEFQVSSQPSEQGSPQPRRVYMWQVVSSGTARYNGPGRLSRDLYCGQQPANIIRCPWRTDHLERTGGRARQAGLSYHARRG